MAEHKTTPIIEAENAFRKLNDRELDCVFGGADAKVSHSEFVIVKLVDKASPKFF
jgi:type VI protein secretion system component Hcp